MPLPSGGDGSAHDLLITLLKSHATEHPSEKPKSTAGRKKKKSASSVAAAGDGGGKRMLVVVLEEIDRLLDRGPEEVYRLFMLPHTPGEIIEGFFSPRTPRPSSHYPVMRQAW